MVEGVGGRGGFKIIDHIEKLVFKSSMKVTKQDSIYICVLKIQDYPQRMRLQRRL